ncbi:hypothetical protein IJT17_04315 [bacterium]|nr:hypothetical protein [bacterium]
MKKINILLALLITLAGLWAIPAQSQLPSSHILVSCFLDELLTVVDARAIRVVNKISVQQIANIAVSPDNKFLAAGIFNRPYMPIFEMPSLRPGTTSRGEHLKSIKAMEFSRDSARLYILSSEDSTLYELHVPSFNLIRSLKLQFYQPEAMILTKDCTKMYITHPEVGAVSIIDLLEWQYAGDIRFQGHISGIALSPDEKKLCVLYPNESLLNIYDAESIKPIGTAPTERGACQVKVNDNNVAIVLNSVSNSISIININNTLDRRILQVGNGPRDVLLMPGGQGCYVANYTSGDLSVIDLNSIRQLGRLAVGRGACCLRWMQ